MKPAYIPNRPDPDMQAVPIALMRAAQRARQLARQTGTKLAVMREGKLVELDPDAGEPVDEVVGGSQG